MTRVVGECTDGCEGGWVEEELYPIGSTDRGLCASLYVVERKVIGTDDGLAWFVVGVVSGSVGLTNQSEFVSRIQKVVRGGIGQNIL